LKEARGQFDAMAQKARAKWAECERLDKDIETKRVELTAITQQLAKIRQQLGG
jgi:SMC interacting uncharacterized protein involved in chromosome segregation